MLIRGATKASINVTGTAKQHRINTISAKMKNNPKEPGTAGSACAKNIAISIRVGFDSLNRGRLND